MLIKLAGIGGGILGAGGIILSLVSPGWIRWVTVMEAVAFGLLAFFFIMHFEALKDFSRRRSTRFGANSLLMVILFLGILGIGDFLFSRHHLRLDLSEGGQFSLSPQTITVLKDLKKDVRMTAFFQEGSGSRAALKDLVDSYRYRTQKISVEFIDPDRSPAIAKKYGITAYDTTVLESGSQEATVRNPTEQELTNALIRVTREGKKIISFVEGHGEHPVGNQEKDGYSLVKDSLEKEGYGVKSLLLLQEGQVPQETAVVVAGGPQKPFLPHEISALETFLSGGGQLLLLLDPETKQNLGGLLSAWGITLDKDIIIDPFSRLFGGDYTVPIVNTYPTHPATQEFNLATFFPLASSLTFDPAKEKDFLFSPLAQTTPNSWGEKNLDLLLTRKVAQNNPQEDRQGPLTLAAAVTFKKEGTSSSERARFVVIGDSDFAANGSFHFSGNGDFFLNVVSWLAQEEDLISIRPKETKGGPLFLSAQQGRVLLYFPVIILPASVLIVGLTIYRKRRRL